MKTHFNSYLLFIESLQEPVIIFGNDGDVLKSNQAFQKLFNPLITKSSDLDFYVDLFQLQDANQVTSGQQKNIEESVELEVENKIKYLTVRFTQEELTKVRFYMISIKDNTDYENERQNKKEIISIMDTFGEVSGDGIYRKDLDFNLLSINNSFREIFGLKLNERIENIEWDDLHANPNDYFLLRKKLIERNFLQNEKVLLKRKNGEEFLALINCWSYQLEGKNWYGGSIKDLSNIEKFDRILVEKNLELKESNELLDNLIYRISHDLTAPILRQRGLYSLLGETDEATSEILYLLKLCTDDLYHLVRGLENFAMVKNKIIDSKKVEIKDIIGDIIDDIDQRKRKVDISINFKNKNDIYTDVSLLKIILGNVIRNSQNYYDPEKDKNIIKIEIDSLKDKAEIKVWDNGKGIQHSLLPYVFNLFVKGPGSTGTGLGLFISKSIIKRMGGEMFIDSKYKKHTSVSIIIPNGLKDKLDLKNKQIKNFN